MVEAAMFNVAAKLLTTIASPAFKKLYEKASSIKSARKDLRKLETSIETIQAVLLDAERRQDSSVAIKNWIMRVRDVLYDADDLFDEVATDDMLRRQDHGNKPIKKVRAFFSPSSNPIGFDKSVAKRVKDIRKSLLEISEDMKAFHFVDCLSDRQIGVMRKEQDPGLLFVGIENVIGRDMDKKSILEMLLEESKNDAKPDVSVLAIVGIGGMGKTTLAHLVYNDEKVQKRFKNRWFVCIYDTIDDDEVIRRIYQSVCKDSHRDLSTKDQQDKIVVALKEKEFLLVLDDVWDDDRGRWVSRMGMWSGGAKGSKVIVTTRSNSVARAIGALKPHELDGLSEEDSWALFKSIVNFTPEQERNPEWAIIGREIVKKCANVPLAIKSIASLLFNRNTLQEWESLRNEDLPKLDQNCKYGVMHVLKFNYEHLSSNLKQCFAYCSLFPKNHVFDKDKLVYLWISQGYVTTDCDDQVIEDVGHSYFMDLVRTSFLEASYDYGDNDIKRWKMHDLIHDLAKEVAKEECIMLTKSSSQIERKRHVGLVCGCFIGDSWLDTNMLNRLRSFLYQGGSLHSFKITLEKQFTRFKCLRALSLVWMGIEVVPSSIGEFKHLRYLDISYNKFKSLPDAITNLVNLGVLNISCCRELELLPNQFRKLTNLRGLFNRDCHVLMHIPPGFEELTHLQHLDEFTVSGEIDRGQRSKLDVLSKLKLRGELSIKFDGETDDWNEAEYWQPPPTLQCLHIRGYRGIRIPHWGNETTDNQASLLPKLTTLALHGFSRVKCLPPFRHLPNLNDLTLNNLDELEYIQGEEEEAVCLPNLNKLHLENLKKLKGWSRKVEVTPRSKEETSLAFSTSTNTPCLPPRPLQLSFPSLYVLKIVHCPNLNHLFSCPSLHELNLTSVKPKVLYQVLRKHGNTIHSSLQNVVIQDCHELVIFPGKSLTSLWSLTLTGCYMLKQVQLAPSHLNILNILAISDCPELEVWNENKRTVDWETLPKLTLLEVDQFPFSWSPESLIRRQELGILDIQYMPSPKFQVLITQQMMKHFIELLMISSELEIL